MEGISIAKTPYLDNCWVQATARISVERFYLTKYIKTIISWITKINYKAE